MFFLQSFCRILLATIFSVEFDINIIRHHYSTSFFDNIIRHISTIFDIIRHVSTGFSVELCRSGIRQHFQTNFIRQHFQTEPFDNIFRQTLFDSIFCRCRISINIQGLNDIISGSRSAFIRNYTGIQNYINRLSNYLII